MLTTHVDSHVEEQALAAAGGDREALARLYERYADPVLRYARLRVGDDLMVAEDVASTTWERVAKSIRGYSTKGNGFPAWLFTITRRTAAEHHRTAGRRRENLAAEFLADDHPDTDATPHEVVEARMVSHRVTRAVRGLAPRQRRCVTLRFYVGLDLADTAAVMKISVGAVKQLQHRGLTTLAGQLGSDIRSLPVAETVVAVDTTQGARTASGVRR